MEMLKTKKLLPFIWGAEHQAAFVEMKKKMCEPPIWGFADYTKPFELEVDASL